MRRIIHWLTMEDSSCNLSCANCVSLSVAVASRPRNIGPSKWRLNCFVVPNYYSNYYKITGLYSPNIPVLTKWSKLKYSNKSFCTGVPDNNIRRCVFNCVNAVYVWFSQFFKRWPYTYGKMTSEGTLPYFITYYKSYWLTM